MTAPTPPSAFQLELQRVCRMAFEGSAPAQCAAEYQTLAAAHPGLSWLEHYAEDWERLGGSWYGPDGDPPQRGNLRVSVTPTQGALALAEGPLVTMTDAQLQAEKERQLSLARARWGPL